MSIDIVFITKEETRNYIRRYFPDFDFSKPMRKAEFYGLLQTVRGKDEDVREKKRLEEASAFLPGSIASHYHYGTHKVKKVSSDGHLLFEGRRGSFHPMGWKLVSPGE